MAGSEFLSWFLLHHGHCGETWLFSAGVFVQHHCCSTFLESLKRGPASWSSPLNAEGRRGLSAWLIYWWSSPHGELIPTTSRLHHPGTQRAFRKPDHAASWHISFMSKNGLLHLGLAYEIQCVCQSKALTWIPASSVNSTKEVQSKRWANICEKKHTFDAFWEST